MLAVTPFYLMSLKAISYKLSSIPAVNPAYSGKHFSKVSI
jgi:hypothetical protein